MKVKDAESLHVCLRILNIFLVLKNDGLSTDTIAIKASSPTKLLYFINNWFIISFGEESRKSGGCHRRSFIRLLIVARARSMASDWLPPAPPTPTNRPMGAPVGNGEWARASLRHYIWPGARRATFAAGSIGPVRNCTGTR